jgi:hypothetical protein
MRTRIDWTAVESAPAAVDVLRSQRLPPPPHTSARVAQLLQDAMETYLALARPRAVVQVLDRAAFGRVFIGEGRNLTDTPLEHVVPRADGLALYVATIGEEVCDAISRMFSDRDPARGYMLDAVASEAADRLALAAGAALVSSLRRSGAIVGPTSVLPYSPGYCGWDITGQRALFAAVSPDDIGVTLSASCLMQPLKSVSGVLVVGPADVHAFQPAFVCCDVCITRTCRHRLASLQLQ